MAAPQQMVLGPLGDFNESSRLSGSVTPIRLEAGDDDADRFTRANLFGLFMTIAFCLVVQPYGSLLYAKPQSLPGRFSFFFWRLNPLACGAEAVLVALILLRTILFAAKRLWDGTDDENESFSWRNLRATATAAVLLRNHGTMPDHLRTLGSRRERARVRRRRDIPNPRRGARVESSSAQGLRSRLLPFSDNMSPSSSIDIADWNRNDHVGAQRRYIAGVRSPTLSSHVSDGSAAALRSRARPRVQKPYHEMFINIFGTIGVLLVVVKLSVVVIPVHLQAAAWCMVAGWAAIQLLVLLSKLDDSDIDDSERILSLAVTMEGVVHSPIAWLLLSALLLPVFGYLIYHMLFSSGSVPWQLKLTYGLSLVVFYVMMDPSVPTTTSKVKSAQTESEAEFVYIPVGSPRQKELSGPSLVSVVVRVVLYWSVGSWFGRSVLQCMTKTPANVHWIYIPLPFLVGLATMLAWLFLPSLTFFVKWDKASWCQSVGLLYNLGNTILLFICAIIIYDDSETYKPGWLDWFGKI